MLVGGSVADRCVVCCCVVSCACRCCCHTQGDFRYQPVLMHERATSIHRTHSNANTYLEVFDVQGHPGAGSSLFIWVATRQLEGLYRNCW